MTTHIVWFERILRAEGPENPETKYKKPSYFLQARGRDARKQADKTP